MKRLIAATMVSTSRGVETVSGDRSFGSRARSACSIRTSGPSDERTANATSATSATPAIASSASALVVMSRASAARARVVWPTTICTSPVKPRSAKRRTAEARRTVSPL